MSLAIHVISSTSTACLNAGTGIWTANTWIPETYTWTADHSWTPSNDPNGDKWRDCGWDGKCPGDPGYVTKENDTEGNGIWDRNEGFEENDPPMYNYIKQTKNPI